MNIPISLIVEGEAIVAFKWPCVPRVGEHLKVGVNPQARRLLVVVDVLYHGESDPRVDLICEEPEQ